ncbi:helix-hairpin-helix domain-containing protein [Halococcus thailandensis]|uniref:Aromatic amino acid cluster protein n=1 Tax=Halococcus thailandensis JCM 13552 TaxID=1227457 RepID=M0N4B1_9EURY|nr:helix-hairpin-helix domain-containing protein [Halococcus thailandensis]EMA51500.1 hypothetical protein C451_14585 [Halococcus thailandensis JCM 13552]
MTLLDTIKSLLGLDDGRSEDRRERSRTTPTTDSEDAVKGTDTDEPAAAGGDAAGSTESIVDEDAEGGAETGEVTGSASSESGDDLAVEGDADADESAAAGGDAAASTGSMTEESSSEGAAEPGEAVGPTDDEELEDEVSDEADESEVDAGDESEDDESEAVDVGDGDGTADEAAAAGSDASGSTGSITEETNESISATEDAEAAGPTDADPDVDTADHDVDALKGIGPSYAERLGEAGIESVADLADADPETISDEVDVAESRVERWSERAKARRQ